MLRRIVSEPLFHFLLIGIAVFVAFRALEDPTNAQAENVIEVSDAQIELFGTQFAAVWNRPPTEQELESLVEEHVREEIYYREALALGLDNDDAVIRRRLRQKMEFLAEPPAEALRAEDPELLAFYEANATQFQNPPSVSFEQVFLGDTDPDTTLQALRSGAGPDEVGARSMLPPGLQDARHTAVDGTFGTGFFQALLELPVGTWEGPVASSFGQHLVRLSDRQEAALLPFEDIRGFVEAQWQAAEAVRLREEIFSTLRDRYTVVRSPSEPPS